MYVLYSYARIGFYQSDNDFGMTRDVEKAIRYPSFEEAKTALQNTPKHLKYFIKRVA